MAARGRPVPGSTAAQGRAYRAARRRGRHAAGGAGHGRLADAGTGHRPAAARPAPSRPLHYPNPEEPGVLDLARDTAEQVGADLVLANDPDADRLAVMVPGPGGWRALTGDELGALLGDAVLTRLARGEPVADPGGRPPVVATTVVSGSLLRRLAEAAGVRCVTHADRVQVDRAGGRGRRRPDLRLRAGPRLRRAAGPGGRQGRDQRGAARPPAGDRGSGARPHPARPARRPRPGPRPARHRPADAEGGRRDRSGPAQRRGRTGQEGTAAAAGRAAGHGDRPAARTPPASWTWPAATPSAPPASRSRRPTC